MPDTFRGTGLRIRTQLLTSAEEAVFRVVGGTADVDDAAVAGDASRLHEVVQQQVGQQEHAWELKGKKSVALKSSLVVGRVLKIKIQFPRLQNRTKSGKSKVFALIW